MKMLIRLASVIGCLVGAWSAEAQDANRGMKSETRLCMSGAAELIDKDKVAILVEPQLRGIASGSLIRARLYYAIVSLQQDAAGQFPYDLFGPFPSTRDVQDNPYYHEMSMEDLFWHWNQDLKFSYELKNNGIFVQWRREAGATFNRFVFDPAKHAWSAPRNLPLPDVSKQRRYPRARYVVVNSAIFDLVSDNWVEDVWANKIVKTVKRANRDTHFFFTDDRQYILVDAWGDAMHAELLEENEIGNRRVPETQFTFGESTFNKRKSIMIFKRDSDQPTIHDKYVNSTGPYGAFVDKLGELLTWYEPCYVVNGGVYDDIALIPLHGDPKSRLERANWYYYTVKPDHVLFDREQSALIHPSVCNHDANLEPGDTRVPLNLQILTWKFADDKKDKQEVDLSNMFEIRGSDIVPKSKPAVPVPEVQ